MPESKEKDYRILKLIKIVNAKFHEDFDFNQLADTLRLSPSRLRHLFREETGMSFRKYLRLVRLRRAKHLLETTLLRLDEIAEQVGIQDISHFVKDFKKQFGLPPESYRRKHLSEKEKSVLEN